MIIYWPGVYTFNGYFSEEDLQMFWVYRYKGFSFTAARTVHTALVLAGQQGCSQADTGHLLLALVQTAQGTAADFLRRKRVTSTALAEHNAAHAAGRPRRLHSRDLAPELSKGLNLSTLSMIREFLSAHPGESFTSEQIAAQVHLSRITVRRYVSHMVETHELESSIDYRTGGRPSIQYQFVGK